MSEADENTLGFIEQLIKDTLAHLSEISVQEVAIEWQEPQRDRANVRIQYCHGERNRMLAFALHRNALADVDKRTRWLQEILDFAEIDTQVMAEGSEQ